MKEFPEFKLETEEVVPLGSEAAYEIGNCHRIDEDQKQIENDRHK